MKIILTKSLTLSYPLSDMIEPICNANPQCTRSADVMATLEARDPQLPENIHPKDCDATLLVTTPQGKVVQQYTLYQPTGQKIIDLKGLADGLYYITLMTKRNLVVTRKITVAN